MALCGDYLPLWIQIKVIQEDFSDVIQYWALSKWPNPCTLQTIVWDFLSVSI